MKRLALVLLLLIAFQSHAQRDEAYVDEQLSEFTTKLEERSIYSWFSVKRYCTGSVEMFQMDDGSWCSSKGTYFETYVVWVEDDATTMIKKLDNCGLFYSIPLKSNAISEFVNDNIYDLTATSVKNYEADNISGRPELRTGINSCKRNYVIKRKGSIFKHNYNLFDLTTSEEHPNVHYEYNKSLKIVQLDKMLDEVIEDLQSKFKRQKK